MRTTLTIECDIRDAQAILYEASKIIDKRNECQPAKFKVKCRTCSWVGSSSCNTRCPSCGAMIKTSDVISDAESGSQSDLRDVYFPENAKKLEDLKWKPAMDAGEDFTVASQSSMEPPSVLCPFCDWTGYIIELKIDGNKYRRCPKCHGQIIAKDVTEETHEVMPKGAEHKPILPVEVMCPHCDWTGRVGKLRVDGDMKVMCPKCPTIITTNNIKKGVV